MKDIESRVAYLEKQVSWMLKAIVIVEVSLIIVLVFGIAHVR